MPNRIELGPRASSIRSTLNVFVGSFHRRVVARNGGGLAADHERSEKFEAALPSGSSISTLLP